MDYSDSGNLTGIVYFTYALIILIAVALIVLFSLRSRAIWQERRTRHYLEKYENYFDYVASHLHDKEPLQRPDGHITRPALKVIQKKLFDWMQVIVGTEQNKLSTLCRDLGLVELNMQRLRSEIHGTRLDAVHNLGVMQAKEAVPALLQLLEEEKFGAPSFVIARAISKCAGKQEELDRMVRILVKQRKQSHSHLLVVDVLNQSRIDCSAMLYSYLRDGDLKLVKIGMAALRNKLMPGMNELLWSFVRSNDSELRLMAVQAIVRQGTPMKIEQMAELMKHEDAAVRAEAADAFGQLGLVVALSLLKEGLIDTDWRVRYNSARSLIRLGDEGFQALCEVAARERGTLQASLAMDIIEEELSKGPFYSRDLKQTLRHNNRLRIHQQYFVQAGSAKLSS
ncbi:HEAT repeat domain-containing protein [Aneurinibacillus sp. Ricciae_BoGa-3]|uniref:HEAT repeat domain-containing protein n=1 Tax=Aneurinibacillus sp. Ricciae_BoGa-3 TaxID=3022697 RepID=UPI0023421B32|nr:HEAT repeat domain-containing protein [Aneurinibacillus sp. Ricciae_BoGa-3]WCK53213.1 HEAT repeat domain-containing protein [Aneurinibacillus sp. Ricciae_BoGa-3]